MLRVSFFRVSFLISLFILGCNHAIAGLVINDLDRNYLFDFNTFRGVGVTQDPSSTQIDSDVWRFTGLSDGTGEFGGSYLTGDWARGAALSAVSTGGIYAFNHGSMEEPDWSLGFQPTANDFNPGALTMRVINGTQSVVDRISFGFDLLIRNNATRSSVISLQYGLDDLVYRESDHGDWFTDEAPNENVGWEEYVHQESLLATMLSPGDSIYFRWLFRDGVGQGSRDELSIDNVIVNFGASSAVVPEPHFCCWLLCMLAIPFRYRAGYLKVSTSSTS